jgi:predicted peroxiredoxin
MIDQKDEPPRMAESSFLPKDEPPTVEPPKKNIVVRLKRYASLHEQEIDWEALRSCNQWLANGANVSLLLDMEGVQLANQHNMDAFQVKRGSSGRMIPMKELFTSFLQNGGKAYAAERWTKTFGLTGGSYSSLFPGVELLDDDNMNKFVMDHSGEILEY